MISKISIYIAGFGILSCSVLLLLGFLGYQWPNDVCLWHGGGMVAIWMVIWLIEESQA